MPQATNSQEGEHLSETTLRQLLQGILASKAMFQAEGHLASCSQCRARLDELVWEGSDAKVSRMALVQAFVRGGLDSPDAELAPTPQPSPDFDIIAAYVDGTLTPEQTRTFETWMQQRPRLAEEVKVLRALKEELQSPLILGDASTATSSTSNITPSMVVKRAETSPLPTTWWKKWRWPIPSLGLATAMALLLLFAGMKPWQHKPLPQKQSNNTPVVSQGTPSPIKEAGINERGGPNQDDTVQERVLALSNPRPQSEDLFDLVKILPYNVKGNFDSRGVWHSVQGVSVRRPLAFSSPLKFQTGDGMQFDFANKSKQTLYLVLLWMSHNGTITPLTLPKSNDSPVIKLMPQGTSQSQVSTARYGVRTHAGSQIKIFVSTRPVHSSYLKFDGMERGTLQRPELPSPLDIVLAKALGDDVPSKSPTSEDYKTWATKTLEVRIHEK